MRLSSDCAAEEERALCISFLRGKAAEVTAMIGRPVNASETLTAGEATQLARRLNACADGIDAGLHLEGSE
jgi:hypothetical protein